MWLFLYRTCNRPPVNKLGLLIADDLTDCATAHRLFKAWDGRPADQRLSCCRVVHEQTVYDYASVWDHLRSVSALPFGPLTIRKPDGSPAIYANAYCNRLNAWLPGFSVNARPDAVLSETEARDATFSRITVISSQGKLVRPESLSQWPFDWDVHLAPCWRVSPRSSR